MVKFFTIDFICEAINFNSFQQPLQTRHRGVSAIYPMVKNYKMKGGMPLA